MEFKHIEVRPCSCGLLRYEVTYADDTVATYHDGCWPVTLSVAQHEQLRRARDELPLSRRGVLVAELTTTWDENTDEERSS